MTSARMSVNMTVISGERDKMRQDAPGECWQELGRQLAERRRELGYGDFRDRARFVRERAGGRVSYRTVQRLENGERVSHAPETIRAIAEIYAVTPESVRAVVSGKGGLAPAPAGSAALPKPGIAAAGDVAAPDEVAVRLPRIVAEHWGNANVRTIWGLDAPEAGRVRLIRELLGLAQDEGRAAGG